MIKELLKIANAGRTKKERPLGDLSDFIVEELPTWSERVSDHSSANVSRLADRLDHLALAWQEIEATDSVGLLDLKMVHTLATVAESQFELTYMGAAVSRIDSHRQALETKIKAVAVSLGRPALAALTYQDIVLDNPRHDVRSFLRGDVGQSEMAFYIAHQQIESHLQWAITNIQAILSAPEFGEEQKELLRDAYQDTLNGTTGIKGFNAHLDPEHFSAFKPFFATSPFTGEKGPSGAFSAKVPHMDILLYGKAVPASTSTYLDANGPYFPQADLAAARKSQQEGKCLIDLLVDELGTEHRQRCYHMAEVMLGFRRMHKKVVVKHIGSDVIGSAEGSGATQFLDQRIAEYEAALAIANKKLFLNQPARPQFRSVHPVSGRSPFGGA